MDLSDRRERYETRGLDVGDLAADPFDQFGRWYSDAEDADLWEPNACVVSTVDEDGWPSGRFVLLKSFDQSGFSFFTNYSSDKAAAFDHSRRAALTFGWLALRRQVRIVGSIERTSETESDEYFRTRPRGSQIGAAASPQSQVVSDRAALEARFQVVDARYHGAEIPRPTEWGGYRVRADSIEFWQGRPDRLHDRLRYRLEEQRWVIERLAP